ncbi:hypothetical protein HanXRQr2_Chr12g0538661 [Helianthus annuus]|uniref:Uncharacterized protein n=1 Tax=Helianthus annuus TaxID=4232 RepID=A0A9K3HG42_HELAN|nr:hypothetical protein HanXRQr2_Chr12g0538661 [Helianthus annuus]KAJ0862459.1 hypothetical protein HanPSC8_Chr12g0518481 [Helianthus annuus]
MIITRFHVQNDIVFVGCPSVPISEGRSEPLKGIQIFKISLSYQKD